MNGLAELLSTLSEAYQFVHKFDSGKHDVSQEGRDESGKWTSGSGVGTKGKASKGIKVKGMEYDSEGAKATIPELEFNQETDPQKFKEAMAASTRSENHSQHSDEELKDSRMFLSKDGKVGFMIRPDGDFGNLFNNGGPKGAGQAALIAGVKLGAKTLDCYDGFLPKLYAKFGFKADAALGFNDEYAPPGWNFDKLGRPDVVFCHYDGGDRETIEKRIGQFPKYDPGKSRRVDSWDEGKGIASAALDNK